MADPDADKVRMAVDRFKAHAVAPEDILAVDADLLAPCALGVVLNPTSIPDLRVSAVCGAANNQLANPADAKSLADRGILYAPDYVVNAGGIINVAAEYLGEPTERVEERVRLIPNRLGEIFEQAHSSGELPHAVADRMASRMIGDPGFWTEQ